MKRWFSRRWLVVCLLASDEFSAGSLRSSVAEADGPLESSVPKSRIRTIELTLPNSDKADVYYPRTRSSKTFADAFPVVIVLQGANVDKIHYERFGRRLARHGFVVVIPNHFRSLPLHPPAPPVQSLHQPNGDH